MRATPAGLVAVVHFRRSHLPRVGRRWATDRRLDREDLPPTASSTERPAGAAIESSELVYALDAWFIDRRVVPTAGWEEAGGMIIPA